MKEIRISMSHMPLIEGEINACIGYFDGLHQGHQTLIQAVLNASKENGATSALITFAPDPWTIIKGLQDIPHITTMQDRMDIAKELGVELWIILEFTEEMAALCVEDFHKQILNPLPLKTLVCGYDYRYAHFGKGDIHTLKTFANFNVLVIDEVSMDHKKISSTRIEQLILDGDMAQCRELLTRPYALKGRVVHGLQNGRRMGFPTANLQLEDFYIIPKEGVYAGYVIVQNVTYEAMINIGHNPTFKEDRVASIEAHIFDFDQTIYGEQVSFLFISYLRGDQKFSSIDALIEQLKQDTIIAKQSLRCRKAVGEKCA